MTAQSMFADVAVPMSVDKVFTYAVPQELCAAIAPGVRVVVPFGRRIVTGIVVATPSTSPVPSPKFVADVLDPAPILSEDLIQLTRWMSEYYMAAWGDVLKAVLVHNAMRPGRRRVSLKVLGDDLRRILARSRPSSRQAALLRLLMHGRSLSVQQIQKQIGTKRIHSILNTLVRQGVVAVEETTPRPMLSPQYEQVIEISDVACANWQKWLDEITSAGHSRRFQGQVAVVRALLGCADQSAVSVKVLLKRSGASLSSVRTLVKKGILTLGRREVLRARGVDLDDALLGSRQITLNDSQQQARDAIVAATNRGTFQTFLLHGVTGSGKTQVYIEAIGAILRQGKSAIVLVPEIALTPQIVQRFAFHFGDRIAVTHSRMSSGERFDVWQRARSGKCSVVIGPRSAVFAPLKNLGLIVIDEEQESSYKQFDQTPRYHARDVAIMRARTANAVVVLGSATPSLESYTNAHNGKYTLLELLERVDNAQLPDVTIVDMTEERRKKLDAFLATRRERILAHPETAQREKYRFELSSISDLLKEKIDDRLRKNEGIILLQNRRGFAPIVECPNCGHVEMCDDCNISLTYHAAQRHLRCHYCGRVKSPAETCPKCQSPDIQYRGFGTQRVEQELLELFPMVSIARMDLDTTTQRGAHDRILRKFSAGEVDILLGTQMVAKGLDFSRVTLVGVISADTQMLLPDFRSSERTFQLLTQVAGRAGRSALVRGEVIIQTYLPKHYALQFVCAHDFKGFYNQELRHRRELHYPPFARLVLLEFKGKNEREVMQHAVMVARLIRKQNAGIIVLGPAAAALPKLRGLHRAHIVVKSPKTIDPSGQRAHVALRCALDGYRNSVQGRTRSVKLIVDVDPAGMM